MIFTILIADDEKNIREGLGSFLKMEGYQVILAEDGQEAKNLLAEEEIDLVIADLRMPKISGEELLKHIKDNYSTVPVIILTGHGTVESAVQAMRDGAFDFLTKPPDLDRLGLLVKRALSTREMILQQKILQRELEKDKRFGLIIGKSPKMKHIFEVIEQVAPTKASVLITGESGVGKEKIADAIHYFSDRRDKPLIKVHCAALAETLLESELFGHEKGAFTGAVSAKRGRFELAHGGTLFLDEIGEISPAVQVKLLRVLQEKKFERVGGERTLEVDVRIIAATNKDLKAEVENGNFREDLYYRLNVVHVQLPPLRDRKEDIPLLAAAFLKELAHENNKTINGIDQKARMILHHYSWPGNIRELRNCIESAVVMSRDSIITAEDLPPHIREAGDHEDYIRIPLGSSMEEAEKEIIRSTLLYCNGNKSKAAEILGIGRKTLYRKIEEYNLEQ
ncbi:sigma-54 dependent transcriptional regulator [Spirochaetia bacterium 38H-sp]|uniref:Sigma-54 dependent transcriptional regulator n=1 Tax=Rarispira pelagica TaxID=3141764 RepID=A0ABU9UDW0_9SPIR